MNDYEPDESGRNVEWWCNLISFLDAEERRMAEIHAFIKLLTGGGEEVAVAVAEALGKVEQAFGTVCWQIFDLGDELRRWSV